MPTATATLAALLICHAAFAGVLRARQPDPAAPRNLALDAKATASESQDDLLPDKARDGDLVSRWSGIPGHNQGVWYQLDWDAPQRVAEVYLHQHDRYVMELDIQAWDDNASEWRTLRHLGKAGQRLPLVVVSRFDPVSTRRLRIGN